MLKVLMILPYPELKKQVEDIYEKNGKPSGLNVDIRSKKAEELDQIPDLGKYDVLIGRGHQEMEYLRTLGVSVVASLRELNWEETV